MMKVLVTGGGGFIGSHTVDMLIEKGFDVRILDKFEEQVHGTKKPDYINPKAELMQGDIDNKDTWKKALQDVQGVIHLAAMVGMGQSMYQPIRYMHVNSVGTAAMYETIVENPEIKKNIESIVGASSKSIYGEGSYICKEHGKVNPMPRSTEQLEKSDWEAHCPVCDNTVEPTAITEDKPAQNLAAYSLSKYDTERLVIMFGETLGITSSAMRFFNVYGPRQSLSNPYTGVAAIFMSRVKNNNPPIIYEDGKQIRDFIYVEDIARANVMAFEKAKKTDMYNVGTGKTTSIMDIAKTIIELKDAKLEPEATGKFRAGDNRHDYSDISKIKKAIGFEPKWDIKQGMEKLIEWSEGQEAVDKFEEAEKERVKFLGG